jgi:putative Holliday junction resolvase
MVSHQSEKRILAVDWGEKRLGIAISDPLQTLARPYDVINHVSRSENAKRILKVALREDVGLIVIGVTFDGENRLTHSGRSGSRLGKEIRNLGKIPVIEWDEEKSTQDAIQVSIGMKNPRRSRNRNLDSRAAAFILQSYLDSKGEI